MTTSDIVPWLGLFLSMIIGIGVPVLIFMAGRHNTMLINQDKTREDKFNKLDLRLDHLDTCIDEVKGVVLSKSVTREDLVTYRAETTDILNRMRLAISNETTGLHDRLMRLENIYFARTGGEGD